MKSVIAATLFLAGTTAFSLTVENNCDKKFKCKLHLNNGGYRNGIDQEFSSGIEIPKNNTEDVVTGNHSVGIVLELIDKQAKTSHLEICNGHFIVQLWITTVPAPGPCRAVRRGITALWDVRSRNWHPNSPRASIWAGDARAQHS